MKSDKVGFGKREEKNKDGLHAKHLADLKKSGLTDETIEKAGIITVSPAEISGRLGFNVPALVSGYEISYGNGFSRFKVFYKETTGTKKFPKYLQPKNTGNRLYVPASVKPSLKDPTCPLYLTEGEKKALKAAQEGLCCIGLSGLWNWSNGNKGLISDFDLIGMDGRTIFIVPDNDWTQPNKHGYKKNLQAAVYELAEKLIERGAKVSILSLSGGGGEKIGLDDYLCVHSVRDLQALPLKAFKSLAETITQATESDLPEILERLARVNSETKRSLHVQKLANRLKLPKRSIQNDLKALIVKPARSKTETVICANMDGLVDLVFDKNGEVSYLFKCADGLQLLPEKEIDGVLHLPPREATLPFGLPRATEVISWYKLDDDQQLFEDVITYLRRFSYLEEEQWLAVTCVIFLSYIQDHPDVRYSPILLFYAIPERGKSRTGEAISYVAYRGIHLTDLREANLFRFSENMKATLFFDVMNLWKKAQKNEAEDILLSRFEKGAKVSRVLFPEKGAFEDMVHYHVYGPTIIATNESVHHILDTRCISITIPNKPGEYENPRADKAQVLKERLTAFRARAMDAPLLDMEPLKGLEGRLWDISKPLLQICQLVHPSSLDGLNKALQKVAEEKIEDKRAGIDGLIVTALADLSPEKISEWVIKTAEVLENLNKPRPDKWKLTPQYLGKKLRAMGFHTKIVSGYSEIRLNRDDFDKLIDQFKIEVKPTPVTKELEY